MTRNRDELEEQNVERALSQLRDEIDAPAEDELRSLAQAATATPQELRAPARPRARLRLRVRWTVAAAAAALLVGSGLGFGLGNSVTPTVQARTNPFAGTGFLPAQGWNVVQAGTATGRRPATAFATNVRLHPSDRLRQVPTATIASLPAHGVLIHATFSTRGDPTRDALFRERSLPLQVSWAKPEGPGSYRLRAATGGYNVDARIHFGAVPPSTELLGEAQLQLSRLVVAPVRVTLSARPTSLRWGQPATLLGQVSSPKEHEEVTLQARDCGQRTFTAVAVVQTHAGGTFTTPFGRAITSTIRAVWNGEASAAIVLRQQPFVQLLHRSGQRYAVSINARAQFWRKKVLVQRRVGSRWTTIRTVAITDTAAPAGTGTIFSEAEFRLRVPRGAALRAVLPADQAKPCYLPATSTSIRA